MKLSPAPQTDAVVELLKAANLPTDDVNPELLKNFIGAHSGQQLLGAIGYEPYAQLGLLRSLVVAPDARGLGLGSTLVAELEKLAAEDGVAQLYLLTTDAENYFTRHGYNAVKRESVPAAIRTTTQFSSLCPGSATVMVKSI